MSKTDKPLLVFVPGLGASGEVYRPLLDALSKDYDVVSADHSPRLPKRLSRKFFFDPIDRAIGRRGQAVLLGHSMGGAIALAYAARHPRKIMKTVAVSPVLFPFQRHRRKLRERATNFRISLLSGHPSHGVESLRIIRARAGGGRAKRLYDWSGNIDLTGDLPKLHHATILFPRREEIIPFDHLRRVQHDYPNIDCRLVPGSHHHAALNPRKLIPIITEALDG